MVNKNQWTVRKGKAKLVSWFYVLFQDHFAPEKKKKIVSCNAKTSETPGGGNLILIIYAILR